MRGRGFTLVEMLVALGLLGLLSLLAVSALSTTLSAWTSAGERWDERAAVQVAQTWIGDSMRAARREAGTTTTGDGPAVWIGGPRRVRYLVALPAHLGGGLAQVEIAQRPGADGRPGVALRMTPLLADAEVSRAGEAAWHERILVPGAELELAYYAVHERGEGPRWSAHWPDPQALPAAVRFTLRPTAGCPLGCPPLVVAPRAAGAGPGGS